MTINANCLALNQRLTALERCAEAAPEGTYQRAKEAAEAVHEASQGIMDAFRNRGFQALNGDQLRSVEAAIYGYLLAGNPNEYGLITGEGFGEALDGPARDRVLADAIRDRDSLRDLAKA